MDYQKIQKTRLEQLMKDDLLAYLKIRANSQADVERQKAYRNKVKSSRKWK